MRNVSQHGATQQCDRTNSCIYKICHTAPGDERPPLADIFCGIV
jgi:hypothetical protein